MKLVLELIVGLLAASCFLGGRGQALVRDVEPMEGAPRPKVIAGRGRPPETLHRRGS